jgi:hypothetical protein
MQDIHDLTDFLQRETVRGMERLLRTTHQLDTAVTDKSLESK